MGMYDCTADYYSISNDHCEYGSCPLNIMLNNILKYFTICAKKKKGAKMM